MRTAKFLAAIVALLLSTGISPGSAANVSGRVVTTNGVGIPGIDLDVIDAATGETMPLLDDDTDADGSFDFRVPDGRYLVRFEADPGLPLVSLEFRDWILESTVDWPVTMEVGAYLTGSIETPGGAPLPGADVRLYRRDRESRVHAPEDETDGSGRFRVVVPMSAEIEVTVKPPAGNDLLARITLVPPLDADTVIEPIRLDRGHRVQGTAQYQGVGVERVNIDAFHVDGVEVPLGHDKTDVAGGFEIVLPVGDFVLVVRPRLGSGLAASRSGGFGVTGDRSVPPVSLSAGELLWGRVTDDTESGVGDAIVSLTADGTPIDVVGGETNAAGDYRLVAPPGVYNATVVAPAFRQLNSTTVSGLSLDRDVELNVTLEPGVTPITFLKFEVIRSGADVVCRWDVEYVDRYVGFRLLRVAGGGPDQVEPVHAALLTPASVIPGLSFMPGGITSRFEFRLPAPDGERFLLEAVSIRGEQDTYGPLGVGSGGESPVSPPVVSRLAVSPNPARGPIRVRLSAGPGSTPSEDPAALSIYSAQGRRVASLVEEGRPVSGGWAWDLPARTLSRLPAGVYFLRAQWGGMQATGRLVRVQGDGPGGAR